jgi:phosphoglycolate phosphatase-like HAD superfamily hydrolase
VSGVLAVFDIDGVVADVRHRLHHLEGPRSWPAFFDAAGADPLLPEGARLVADLAREHEIVWLTGRPAWLRDTTADWLARHGLPGTELHLRPGRDHRPARLYKVEVLRRLAPRRIAAFVDDDSDVVDAAVAAGFPAALADWVPRDATLRDAQERFGRT